MRELLFSLQRMYESIAEAVNGTIRGNVFNNWQNWTPTLAGTSTPGTFTYTHQVGWVLRQGIIVDVWFDVLWSAKGSAAGNLYVELPYKVAVSSEKPFVGVVQHSNITITGFSDIVVNAIPDTYRGEFWKTGSGAATANLTAANIGEAGQLIGHVRYIGQENEEP